MAWNGIGLGARFALFHDYTFMGYVRMYQRYWVWPVGLKTLPCRPTRVGDVQIQILDSF